MVVKDDSSVILDLFCRHETSHESYGYGQSLVNFVF